MRANQLAVGIQIVGGAADPESHLIGVITDRFAKPRATPTVERLRTVDQGDVVDAVERLVTRLSGDLYESEDVVAVGVEISGLVHRGIVYHSPTLNWRNVPLGDRLKDRLTNKVVVLVNDANALAVYERDFPDQNQSGTSIVAAINLQHFAVVLLTELGVGCGLVLSKKVYQGVRGGSGELGHIQVVEGDSALPCTCGRSGCVQTVATISAMSQILNDHGYSTFEEGLKDSAAPAVTEVLSAGGAALGRGMANVVNLLNPSTMVLYGQKSIVGDSRSFPVRAQAGGSDPVGTYVGAMLSNLTARIFPNAADDLTIIIRTEDDHRGASAAAACAIDAYNHGSEPD